MKLIGINIKIDILRSKFWSSFWAQKWVGVSPGDEFGGSKNPSPKFSPTISDQKTLGPKKLQGYSSWIFVIFDDFNKIESRVVMD